MGLDMMVHEVSIFDLKDMSAFCQRVIDKCCPSINVNGNETQVIDLESIINDDPTFSIPWNLGQELCYWRKHPDLHGWMRNLYYEKGGTGDFNGHTIVLTKENVLQLKKDIEDRKLPHTQGFFFGESYADQDDYKWRDEHDQECIEKMLKAIDNKSLIYYTSSW